MGHEPCEMERDTWLNDCGEHYEHIAVHANDVLIAQKYPQGAVDALINKHNYKLKGTSPIFTI